MNFAITFILVDVTLANLKLAQLRLQDARTKVVLDHLCHYVLQHNNVYTRTVSMQSISNLSTLSLRSLCTVPTSHFERSLKNPLK